MGGEDRAIFYSKNAYADVGVAAVASSGVHPDDDGTDIMLWADAFLEGAGEKELTGVATTCFRGLDQNVFLAELDV